MEHDQIAARLRLALEREAARHELAPGTWPQIEGRLRRLAWHRAGIAAACLAIAVAVATAASILWPASSRPTVSHPHPRPAPSLVIVSRTHLGPAITKIAVGYGGVWVVGQDVIYRVDYATGREVATVSVPGTNEVTSDIATGVGSVWVTSAGGHRGVYRIDPRRNRVTSFLRLPLVPTGIAVAYGRVWATEPTQGPAIVVRIDPRTNRVTGPPIRVGAGAGAIVPAAGALWVTGGNIVSGLSRINPVTGTVTPILANVESVDADGAGSLWVIPTRGGIQRVNPATGQVTATIRLPHAVTVTFWAGSAWASTEPPSTLTRVDPASNRIAGPAVPAGATPIYIASSPSGLWVANSDTGNLLHLARAPSAR
jgi:streptogramin lyase